MVNLVNATTVGPTKVILSNHAVKLTNEKKNTKGSPKNLNDAASFRPKELKLFEPDLNGLPSP